ncbi:MAG: hypothetical protein KJ757_05990 [Planctomycetes bacterium]|nr:hypothetical protein [Planctomycetota bacterium]MBU1518211.1 hypothetical protein [Planctomycetota bacterium]MBU2457123.1 hypothetical protein [Planctomycetota bacterium]MBU2597089.1 hypothetical protein [Planctomycetota bacterium]
MRIFYRIFIGLALLSVSQPVLAVSTTKIDAVRSKESLVEADTAAVEQFAAEAFTEFFEKTDFSDIASLRTTIISRSTSELESGQIQYGPLFFTTVQKEISNIIQKMNALPESYRKTLFTTNLLILVNDLGNVELSKVALDYLQSSNVIIRYWAVNCLTNANIVRQLNYESEENKRLAKEFVQKLTTAAKNETSGDILSFIVQFAAGLKQPSANELLTLIANKRIELYMSWKVNDEMTDIAILKALADRAETDRENRRATAKNFATLYSAVIQRYMLDDGFLDETSKRNLVSVITQSEKLVTQFVSDWPGTLKRAIEKGGGAGLLAEYDSLFGSASIAGKMPTIVGFDYGKNADGSVRTFPPAPQKPPQSK